MQSETKRDNASEPYASLRPAVSVAGGIPCGIAPTDLGAGGTVIYKPNTPASVFTSARTFLFLFLFLLAVSADCFCWLFLFLLVSVRPVPAWRCSLLEQFLFCTFCSVSALFLLVSVSADGLLHLVIYARPCIFP